MLSGGELGIRTPDTLLAYTRLAGEHLRPLGQLSVGDATRNDNLPASFLQEEGWGKITISTQITPNTAYSFHFLKTQRDYFAVGYNRVEIYRAMGAEKLHARLEIWTKHDPANKFTDTFCF